MGRKNRKQIAAYALKLNSKSGKFEKRTITGVEFDEEREDDNICKANEWIVVENDEDDLDELEENDEEDFVTIANDLITSFRATVTKWRPKGYNFGIRGAGTSESTYWRNEKKRKLLEANAMSQNNSILNYMSATSGRLHREVPAETAQHSDDGFEELMCHPCMEKRPTLSFQDAIKMLLRSEDAYVSRSVTKIDKDKVSEFDRRRRLAVCRYLQLLEDGEMYNGVKYNRMAASQNVAHVLFGKRSITSYKSRCIRQWADEFCSNNGVLSTHKYGTRARTKSIITDEDFAWTCMEYLREMPDNGRTPTNFMDHMNETLLHTVAHGPTSISLSTATRWMRYLGFNCVQASKGWFTDGHERADVVAHREIFVNAMEDIERGMPEYDGDMNEIEMPSQSVNGKKKVIITHDESTFYCNEGRKFFWMENGKKKLLPKSAGKSIMVSGFTCPCHGFMSVTREWNDGSFSKRVSYQLFEAGVARDGWFTCKDVVQQVDDYAELFEFLHPVEEFDVYVIFDNSMTHHAKPPGGLDAFALNKSDGGKKVQFQKETWFIDKDTGERKVQEMQYIDATGKIMQKGLERILTERGIYHNPMGHPHLKLLCGACSRAEQRDAQFALGEQCCCRTVMRRQPDFMEQKEWLEETVTAHGFHILFYPKFHCELNFIEYIWGWVKAYHRRTCTYNYNDLRASIGNTMENELPLATVRKYWRYCQRFLTGYRIGLTGALLGYTVKKYTGHRAIPKLVVTELNNLATLKKLPQNVIPGLLELNEHLARDELHEYVNAV